MAAAQTGSAAEDVQVNERLQKIHVSTEYLGKYKSAVSIRDIPTWYFDEPKELGGEDAGPTPLETVLSALCACTSMIIYILQREMKFQLDTMRCDATGVHDVRRAEMKRTGKKFTEVEPIAYHFHQVDLNINIKTGETEERFEKMKEEVARLCPVSRLIDDAGVPLTVNWIRE